MKPSRSTSLRGAAAAAATAFLLSSCGSTAPGVAAEVEGERITDEQVDAFAEVLCLIGGAPATESGTPSRNARFASLQVLLSNELAAEFTDLDSAPAAGVKATLEGLEAARELLPEELHDTFDEVAQEFAIAQVAVTELGRTSLTEAGQTGQAGEITGEAAFAEGQRLIAEEAASADIEVDPRFGEMVDGALQPSNGSLSVPVSDLAVQGSSPEAGEEFTSLLPASQKCESPS